MKFVTLFRIAIRHDYHKSGICRGLELIPSHATRSLMEKTGIQLKFRDGRYEILADAEDNGREPRFVPQGNFCFHFFLTLKDQLFFNYTDLPLDAVRRFPSFSNTRKNPANLLSLHAGDAVSAADLPVEIPLAGELRLPESGKVVVRNIFGTAVLETTTDRFVLPYDLSEEGNGEYTVEVNGKITGSYYARETFFGQTIRGAVDIWHHESLPAGCDFLNADNTTATKDYEIRFVSRKTYWNYLFTGKSLSEYRALAVTDARQEIFFSGPKATQLFDGKEGLVFTSPAPLSLREAGDTEFQLRRNCEQGVNAGLPVISRLPVATPELLHTANDTENVYSEIIVHL